MNANRSAALLKNLDKGKKGNKRKKNAGTQGGSAEGVDVDPSQNQNPKRQKK